MRTQAMEKSSLEEEEDMLKRSAGPPQRYVDAEDGDGGYCSYFQIYTLQT